MLTALTIRNIVLIGKLDLEFGPGLVVLSGETGAGKSIVLDAFALALGARGDAGLVRHGAEKGSVTAVFDAPEIDDAASPLAQALASADLGDFASDEEIILRRVQYSDGRTRGFLNDVAVSARTLRAIGAALVEIHGQHDERALLDEATHLAMVDAFGGLAPQATKVGKKWQAFRQADEELSDHVASIQAAVRDREFLTHALAELEALKPQPGEEQQLAQARKMMLSGARIAEDLDLAELALEGEAGAQTLITRALGAVERADGLAHEIVGPVQEVLSRAHAEIGEAVQELAAARRRAEHDPARLDAAEERLFALRALARKHGVEVDRLAPLMADMAARLHIIETGQERTQALQATRDAAWQDFLELARTLGQARRAAAARFDTQVMAELAPLKLEAAQFATRVEAVDEQDAGPRGLDRAEFVISTNPGTPRAPLRKVASGGELSRVMLALKVVLNGIGGAPTLVFDEIDSGVGGAVADAVGDRLRRLGSDTQVLVVTHSPQVAALAGAHFLIEKQPVNAEGLATNVRRLDPAARREEVARMLAGAQVTDEARAAAQALIGGAA
ncbi:MAG: DNA repair protein RecN [Alphaproteobacteria bacterium]